MFSLYSLFLCWTHLGDNLSRAFTRCDQRSHIHGDLHHYINTNRCVCVCVTFILYVTYYLLVFLSAQHSLQCMLSLTFTLLPREWEESGLVVCGFLDEQTHRKISIMQLLNTFSVICTSIFNIIPQ